MTSDWDQKESIDIEQENFTFYKTLYTNITYYLNNNLNSDSHLSELEVKLLAELTIVHSILKKII